MTRGSRIALSLLLLWSATGAWAESDDEMAAGEEARENAAGTENFQSQFNGRLVLNEAQEGEVIGVFVCDKRAYQLKLAVPELLEKLRPLNGQEVTLIGRPRVNGKYFYARGLAETTANPVVPLRRPRGGGL